MPQPKNYNAKADGRTIRIYRPTAEKLNTLKFHKKEHIIKIVDDLVDKEMARLKLK